MKSLIGAAKASLLAGIAILFGATFAWAASNMQGDNDGAGNVDRIRLMDNNDVIDMGNGADSLTFGAGDDAIDFGSGSHTIWWGGGTAIMNYEFAFSSNDDFIYYFPGSGATDDTLVVSSDDVVLNANNGDVVIQLH